MSNPDPRSTPPPASSAPSLRVRGVVLFVLLIAEILLGNQLATVGSPYPLGYLGAHIGLGLIVMAFSGHLLVAAARWGGAAAKGAALLACLGSIGAVVSGFVFLLGNQSSAALLGMEVLGGLALLGALLVIVFGGTRSTAPVAPAVGPS
jgi:hypothetical protein